jgi:hypothetical protein
MEEKIKYFNLPRPFAEEWIEALESGKYEQTTETLHYINGYCCLGLAGHLCGISDDIMDGLSFVTNNDSVNRLTEDQRERAKILLIEAKTKGYPKELMVSTRDHDDTAYDSEYNDLPSRLAYLNDGNDYNFADIAEWLKDNV